MAPADLATAALPNPDVYLNHLQPSNARAFEVTRNIYIASTGALIWDMLTSLPQDITLARRSQFGVNIVAYFLSRLTALAFCVTSVINKTSPMPDCNAMGLGVTRQWVLSTTFTSFLFLRRIEAVFSGQRLVFYLFCLLWVANAAVSIVAPFGSHSARLTGTGYCINTGIEKFVTATVIMPLIFDSLVFLSISYKIMSEHRDISEESKGASVLTFMYGRAIPRLSKAILQGGQQYYLLTVGMNLAV